MKGFTMDNADLDDVIATVRDLIRDRVIPHEAEIDETDEMPAGLREEAARMGLFGFTIPEEYGGLGLTVSQEVRLVFELGYTTPAFRSMFGTNNGIAGHTLLEGGTDEQKKLYLPKLASGEWIASFALTEEGAGSDPAGLTTSAAQDGAGGYVLNGLKRDWDHAHKVYLAGQGQTGERFNRRLEAADQMAEIEARWRHLPGGFHGERRRIKVHIQAVADTTQVMTREDLCWLAIAAASAWITNAASAEEDPSPSYGERQPSDAPTIVAGVSGGKRVDSCS